MHKKVLKKISPGKEERERFREAVEYVLEKIKITKAEPLLGGSGAKDTWLSGSHDIDIYVRFNLKKYSGKDISFILEKSLNKAFSKAKKLHGSRNYFQIVKGSFTIEIVPILKIKDIDEAENITDLSPLHAEWVKKHDKGDEIRLSKAFCKAAGCYGAESYIKGFSGYVLEVLTIYYNSFDALMRAAAKWKPKEYIDIEGHGVKLNPAKKASPLIVIDPVQEDRNAAAALAMDKFMDFINAAKLYLKKPSESFFFRKEETAASIRRKARGKSLAIVEAVPFKGKEDVVGAKILKTFNYILNAMEEEGFNVLESSWKWDKNAMFWFISENKRLPDFKLKVGPPLKQKGHVEKFIEKNSSFKILKKDKRVYAKMPRESRTIRKFIQNLINNDDNLKQWVKSLRIK